MALEYQINEGGKKGVLKKFWTKNRGGVEINRVYEFKRIQTLTMNYFDCVLSSPSK